MGHILIIDSEENSLRTLKDSVACYGDVSTIKTYANINSEMLKQKFDLIISDYHVQDRSCFQVLSEFRHILGPVPLILVSNKPSVEMLTEALEQKIYAFLEKPVDLKRLKGKIENFYSFNPDFEIQGRKIALIKEEWCVNIDDERIELTETEFKIFRYILEREKELIDRKQLIKYLWGETKASRNKLDTHLTNLKSKIAFLKENLQTIPRIGFKLKLVA